MSRVDNASKLEAVEPQRISPTKLRHTAGRLVGREEALARLDGVWDEGRIRVVVIHAWGGVGKTSLVAEWMARMASEGWRGARWVFDWSFYSQGTRPDGDGDKAISADVFIAGALAFFGDLHPQAGTPWDRGAIGGSRRAAARGARAGWRRAAATSAGTAGRAGVRSGAARAAEGVGSEERGAVYRHHARAANRPGFVRG